MQAIERGEIDSIIVRKGDRLWRYVETGIQLINFLLANKVTVFALDETVNLDGKASSNLQLNVALAVAQYHVDTTSENVRRSKQIAKEQGLKMGPTFTLGYADGEEQGTVKQVPEAIPVVKEVFARYIKGDSVASIVRWLNKEHLDLLTTYGKEFYASSVRRMLKNIHYIGKTYDDKGNAIKSPLYDSIIDADTFLQVQKLHKIRQNPKHGKRVAEHLLSGFLTCGYCGRKLTAYSRYSKITHERVGTEYKCKYADCKNPSAFIMRETFWDEWGNMFLSAEAEIKQDVPVSGDLLELQLQLEQMQRNVSGFRKQATEGKLDPNEYQELTSSLKVNISKLQSKIESAKAKNIADKATEWKPWEELTIDEKRQRIEDTVESIRVYKDSVILKYRFNAGTGIGMGIDFTLRNLVIGDSPLYFPLIKRHVEGHKSQRPFHTLTPANVDKAWQGFTEAKVNGQSYLTPDYF